jgi:Na+/phosphate symporter
MQSFFRLSIISALALFAAGCLQNSDDPKLVADTYWKHLKAGEYTQAEKYLSKASRNHLSHHAQLIDTIDKLDSAQARTIVTTTITRINPKTNYAYQQTFDTVLVLEDGEWKIDASQSSIPQPMSDNEQEMRQFADEFSENMEQNMQSIDESMEESMKLLNDMIEQGSQEMSESLMEMMDKLNESMRESVDQLKQRRKQQEQHEQQQMPPPNEDSGEGMI